MKKKIDANNATYQIHVVWFLGVSIYSNAYMYWEGNTETNNVQKKYCHMASVWCSDSIIGLCIIDNTINNLPQNIFNAVY